MTDDKRPDQVKWLILAYFFNNDGKAASQTITDRIPLLMESGIMPVALSSPLGLKDKRFPHARIFSLAPSGLQYELQYLLKRKKPLNLFRKALKALTAILLLPFYLVERLVIHLDSHWSWGPSAVIRGLGLLLRHSPKLIYSTAGPASTHLAGLILHTISGIPWIAEIHDPLVYDFDKGKKNQRYLFNLWLEKQICSHAGAVIYFTRHALESADRRHPIKGRKVVLRPGADPPVTPGVAYRKTGRIHFAHFGSLATTRNLAIVIEALHNLLGEHPEYREVVSLDIYGSGLDSISQKTLATFPLGPALTVHGRLEYDENTGKSGRQQVVEAMRQSDVLLILHGSGVICEEYIPSKVYEYLLLGRPILGLTPGTSELGRILLECGHTVADPDNAAAIQQHLLDFIEAWQRKGLDDVKATTDYTIEKTVTRLISLADEIC